MSGQDVLLKFYDKTGGISTIRCHPSNAGMFRLHYMAKGWTPVEDAVAVIKGDTAEAAPAPIVAEAPAATERKRRPSR